MKTPSTPTQRSIATILFDLIGRTRIAEASLLTYCTWQARDLITAWQNSPHDRLGWLALLIWLFPPLHNRSQISRHQAHGSPLLLGLGLLLSFTGEIGSLNALQHLGLAMVITGLTPLSPRHIPWVLAAISWMPLFGWIGSRWFPDMILHGRIIISVTGSALYLSGRKLTPETSPWQI